jgi:SCP-related protein
LKLTKCATDWAKRLAKFDQMQHRPENLFGENIYMCRSSDSSYQVKGCDPVEKWYSEIKNYDFKTGQWSEQTGIKNKKMYLW